MHELIDRLDNAAWKDLLHRILAAKDDAKMLINELADILRRQPVPEPFGKISARDAAHLVEIGMLTQFPPHPFSAWHVNNSLLFWFVTIRHPVLAKVVALRYEDCPEALRPYALTIVAAQPDEGAVLTLRDIVVEFGLPSSMMPRFFWELSRNIEHFAQTLPLLVTKAGKHIPEVVNLVNEALEKKLLTSEDFAVAADDIRAQTRELLEIVIPAQQEHGVQWRYQDEYRSAASRLGPWIDLFGHLPCDEEVLRQMRQLEDPYLLGCLVSTLLRWHCEPDADLIRAVARDPIQRTGLFRVLRRRPDLYPPEFRNFVSFAESDMARWILNDCGTEAEALDLVSIFRSEGDDGTASYACLWRFRMDGEEFAGVSGPYPSRDSDEPLLGEGTFSRFEPWASKSPEEHLLAISDTLKAWQACR